jgi:Ca2+-binding RTX toxin-like protein
MRGGDNDDTILGGADDDYLDGGLGDDVLNGGLGFDRVSFAVDATVGVTVDLNIAGAQATGHGNDTLTGVEHVSGTKFSDIIIGDGGDNWLWGGSDNTGVTGNDTITAGGGNDLVWVGAGDHTLSGGLGIDTAGVGNDNDVTATGIDLSLALQGAAQATGQGNWNLSGFENLTGSGYDDGLTGDNGDNLLAGDSGNDVLSGGQGDDTLYGDGRITVDSHGIGGSGPIITYADVATLDPLLGGGADTISGGKGKDTILGGGGDDIMSGGQDADLFIVGDGSGDDHVTDFEKKDVIEIEGVAGVDDFSDLTIVNVGGSAVISWGTSDSLTLDGYKASKLTAANFSFDPPAMAMAAFSFGSGPEPLTGGSETWLV